MKLNELVRRYGVWVVAVLLVLFVAWLFFSWGDDEPQEEMDVDGLVVEELIEETDDEDAAGS